MIVEAQDPPGLDALPPAESTVEKGASPSKITLSRAARTFTGGRGDCLGGRPQEAAEIISQKTLMTSWELEALSPAGTAATTSKKTTDALMFLMTDLVAPSSRR